MKIVNNADRDEEIKEEEQREEIEEIRMDMEIEKNIKSFLTYGDAIEVLMIIGVIITAIICFSSENTGVGFIVLICGIISAVVTSMAIKWFAYTLKCLYEIKNNIKQ